MYEKSKLLFIYVRKACVQLTLTSTSRALTAVGPVAFLVASELQGFAKT